MAKDISRRKLLKQAATAGISIVGTSLVWKTATRFSGEHSNNQNKQSEHFDVIVLGLGCMGASACYSLAKQGASVLGVERFASVPHNNGESHGDTKVIRKAYFEGEVYVPLLRRSYDQWREMESKLEKKIIHECGVLVWGPRKPKTEDDAILQQIDRVSKRQGIETHIFDGGEAEKRWPMYRKPNFQGDPYDAIYEPEGGFLDVGIAMRGYSDLAKNAGADLKFSETVLGFTVDEKQGVSVTTNKGSYSANQLVVTGGQWTYDLLAKYLELPLIISPRMQLWFSTKKQHSLDGNKVPVFAYDLPAPFGFVYGFPMLNGERGIKMSTHLSSFVEDTIIKSPDKISSIPHYQDAVEGAVTLAKEFIHHYLPFCDGSNAPYRREACNYTMAPDSHWILDRIPSHSRITIGSGFSGHGFKCSPAIGEILANMALGHTLNPAYDMKFFSIESARKRAGKTQ